MYVYEENELNEILADEGFDELTENEPTVELCEIDDVWELEGVYYA